ncbi:MULTISPECIES: hypothetical protein [Streptomyces]|uniref:hypothetical protein n=1 Tax=Streptomyces TaxID=1883 RepID=UPI000A025457|nr:hypothetical protein [Streptomyces sp. MOE7]ARH89208.1 hypothetical protein STRMOE7_01475 [Streptomyces sp. MOE7]
MTRPDQPASAAVSDDALVGSEAADYARYRPGLPDAAVRLRELVALAQLFHACARGVHPALVPLPARRAEDFTHIPVLTH